MVMFTFAFFLSNRESQLATGPGDMPAARRALLSRNTREPAHLPGDAQPGWWSRSDSSKDGCNRYFIIAPDRSMPRFDAELPCEKP
jgi:hypothetical protein